MADKTNEVIKREGKLSIDGWAVTIALLLTGLVWIGVLKHVGW